METMIYFEGTAWVLYNPYKDAGDWLFAHPACASFGMDAAGAAAIVALGPWGVPIAAAAFSASFTINAKEGDWWSAGAGGAGFAVTPLTVDEFTKFSPQLGKAATRIARFGMAVAAVQCFRQAMQ